MKFPLFIYFELLIRLSEFIPNIGDYVETAEEAGGYILLTTTGQIAVSERILIDQFNDPSMIKREDITGLVRFFKTN